MPRLARRSLIVLGALLVVALAALAALQWAPLYRLAEHSPRPTPRLGGSDGPLIIAHRGWSAVAPENTMAAFERAVAAGVGFELDVHLCGSGEVVVLHDESLERTTDGTGAIEATPLDRLQTLDAGAWFDARFAGERLPTLDAVLARFGGEVLIDIELKTTDQKAELAQGVVDAVRRHGLVEQVMVSSFDPFLLGHVRRIEPAIARGQLVATFEKSDLAWHEKRVLGNLLLNGESQPDIIMPADDLLTPEWLAWLQARGYRVMVWTVDDPAAIERWVKAGVDGIISNTPDRVLDALARRAP